MEFVIIGLLLVIIVILVVSSTAASTLRLPQFSGKRKVIVDSCALIDGRIVELVRTGFLADELVIPKFILSELQLLADGNDSHKRERARFGLEVAAELQEYAWASVSISEENFPGVSATDDKLVKLAKKTRGVLCTIDYNLNKVAAVEGIRTLNVNELSQSLRPVTLPGEEITVKIVQQGNTKDQGVGYLEDGTMIVVDGAAKAIGSTMQVSVDRMHQTVAGKMVFAHATRQPNATKPRNNRTSNKSASPRPGGQKSAPITHVADRLRK